MFSSLPNSVGRMTGPKTALPLLATLLLGAFVVPAEAAAQCRLCSKPETQRDEGPTTGPIRIDVEARLDFDQLIMLDSRGQGTARLNPDGSTSTTGSLGAMTGRTMVGSVTVRGEPGRLVRIDLPASIALYGRTGGNLTLTQLKSDLNAQPRLDSQGLLQFRFGGELQIQGDMEGDYRGDVPITVDYL